MGHILDKYTDYTIYRDTERGLEAMGTYFASSQQDAIETMVRKENLSRKELYSKYVVMPCEFLARYEVPREK